MHPVKTADSNFCYTGPNADIADLPCRVEGQQVKSTWELTSEEMEAIFYHGARIRLTIYGQMPPVMLEVVSSDGPTKRVKAPCDVCGSEVDEPVHLSGADNHAYRHRK